MLEFLPKGRGLAINIYRVCWKVKVLPRYRCLVKNI
jgi:hypothetical protein